MHNTSVVLGSTGSNHNQDILKYMEIDGLIEEFSHHPLRNEMEFYHHARSNDLDYQLHHFSENNGFHTDQAEIPPTLIIEGGHFLRVSGFSGPRRLLSPNSPNLGERSIYGLLGKFVGVRTNGFKFETWKAKFKTLTSIAITNYFLETHGIMHGDLRPENVVENENEGVFLVDFETALIKNPDTGVYQPFTGSKKPLMGYSKQFASPEVLLAVSSYRGIDLKDEDFPDRSGIGIPRVKVSEIIKGSFPSSLGPQSDIYSFGVLYAYLTLNLEEPNSSQDWIRHQIVTSCCQPLSQDRISWRELAKFMDIECIRLNI